MTRFSSDDVDIKRIEEVYRGFFKVSEYHLRFRQFNGEMSETITREVMKRHDAVGVLPYDPVTDEVVMIEQFRAGALNRDHSPWLLELVAGLVDKDEDLETVARRELEEEAGLALQALKPLYDYMTSPGGSSERLYLYCAKVSAANHGKVFGVAEEHEDIKVHVLAADEVFRMVRERQISNAASLVALQWLMLERDALRKEWGV